MKNLIIIGAGGFGREVYNSALESIGYGETYTIKGFLDNIYDSISCHDYPPIIAKIDDYIPQKDDVFVCALGDVRWKKKYVQILENKGGEFVTLIHKEAYISKNVKIGKGCIILAGARIHCDVEIGNYTTIQPYAIIGHDVKIKDWCHVNAFVDCGGASQLGEMVTMHTHSFVLPLCKVGDGATIGASSVAIKDVPPGKTVFGVPAREIIPRNN